MYIWHCRVAGHLLVSCGVGLSLRSARTVLENTIVTAALTAVPYSTRQKWYSVCNSTWQGTAIRYIYYYYLFRWARHEYLNRT